jgi:hypothetical protein
MPLRRLFALLALSACAPLLAASPEALPAAEPLPAAEAPVAEMAVEAPVAADNTPVETPAAAPAPVFEITAIRPPKSGARTVQGTQLLFLRLTLRMKLVEQELLDMSPDQLLEHMRAATDILDQLRSRRLDDNEIARADRAEEYLQYLAEVYVELRSGKPGKNLKKPKL